MSDEIYSLSLDFGGNISPSSLFDEISLDPGVGEDPTCITVVGDVVTISFAVTLTNSQQVQLGQVVAAHAAICKLGISFSETFSDIITFGSTANNLQDAFMNNGDNGAPSNQSAPIAEQDGSVVHVSASTDGDKRWFIDIVADAFNGGAGTYSGGTLIGTVEKPAGQLDVVVDTLGINFLKNQRISAYARKGNGGAAKPLVRLFLSYDEDV